MKNIIMPAMALKAAKTCVAKNDVRYYLNGINIESDRVSSANGHILFSASLDDWEVADNSPIESPGELESSKIIKIMKTIPNKAQYAVMNLVHDQVGLIEYFTGDWTLIAGDMFEVIDGKFPDVQKVIDSQDSKPVKEVGFNAEYLKNIGNIFKCFDSNYNSIKMKFSGDHGTATAERNICGIGLCQYLVMPIRV